MIVVLLTNLGLPPVKAIDVKRRGGLNNYPVLGIDNAGKFGKDGGHFLDRNTDGENGLRFVLRRRNTDYFERLVNKGTQEPGRALVGTINRTFFIKEDS